MRTILIPIALLFALYGCKSPSDTPSVAEIKLVVDGVFHPEEDSIARILQIQCNDSLLIVSDFHSGKSYTLFDSQTGDYLGRFGMVGQGPGEIPNYSVGYLEGNRFYFYNTPMGLIGWYPLDSLVMNPDFSARTLMKCDYSEMAFSKLIPLNDSMFIGAGVYKQKYQYVVLSDKNEVVDYNVDIYNSMNEWFNMYHKVLSNQGSFKKRPQRDQFVFTLNHSSNIDFIELSNGKIQVIKLKREKNPVLKPSQIGENSIVAPDMDSPIGYIDVAAGDNYVYALHTDKDVTQAYSSNTVRVFDWEGNLVKYYKLDREAYFLTVNEHTGKLYAAVRNEEDGWSIVAYNLEYDVAEAEL